MGQLIEAILSKPATFEFAGNPLEFTGLVRLDPRHDILRGLIASRSIFDFEADTYSLTPDPRGSAEQNPDFFVAQDAQGRITECGTCKGFVTLNGRKIAIRAETSADPGHYFAESFDFFGVLQTNPDQPYPGATDLFLADKTPFNVGGQDILFFDALSFWDDEGKLVHRGNVAAGTAVKLHGLPATIVGPAVFAPQGSLSEAILDADATLLDSQGQSHLYPKSAHLTFGPNDAVISAEFPPLPGNPPGAQ